MAAEQVVHHRRRALVRDNSGIDPGFRLEQFRAHVTAGADRRSADIEFARLLLGERDHFSDCLRGKRRMGEQGDRHRRDEADRRKILARVHAELGVKAWVDRQRPGVAEQQRVAVGCGACHRAGADCAAATAAVIDGHGLAERVGQFLRHHAGHRVDAAAGRIGDNERDAARRKISGVCDHTCYQRDCEDDGRCNDDRGVHDTATM